MKIEPTKDVGALEARLATDVFMPPPEVVILAFGTNERGNWTRPEARRHVDAEVARLRAAYPDAAIASRID